jgi:PPK2 family polyphosphate:nucleotide phosphotransferase
MPTFPRLGPVDPSRAIGLDDRDARAPDDLPSKDAIVAETDRLLDRLGELQRVLYADARHALLIVLQGRDASGKDGTIRKVFGAFNPQGCQVTSFKAPTELERRHDFLWRVHLAIPPRGMIGVFNRSHYEDVLVVRVHEMVPTSVWSERYARINEFERLLADGGVVIRKFMLHISHDEQRERLLERITDPDKNWKFRAEDLDDRERWNDYTDAYRDALSRCSTPHAPWFVVPADSKKVRDYYIARELVETLEALELRFPPPDPALKKYAKELKG